MTATITELPRVDLVRMSSHAALGEDGNTLVGYPIVFNEWTDINSWEGKFRERIAPEALTRTLKNRGDKVKVLFNHGHDPAVGNVPLGKPRIMEPDATGLRVEVPLSDTAFNKDLRSLIADGAIDGMSFRFTVNDEIVERGDDGIEERTITELTLYEFGPVTFPAYEATTIGLRAEVPADIYTAFRDFIASRPADQAPAAMDNDGPPIEHLSLEERNRRIREVETYLDTGVLLTQETDNGRTTERDRSTTG